MPALIKRINTLLAEGPTVEVIIWPPAGIIRQFKVGEIPSKTCIGLIDTGASMSAIDTTIATSLNLISRDFIPVLTPAGLSHHYSYDIGIMLPRQLENKMYFIEVTGSDLSKQPYDVLVGRDVLQYCTLIFNGWDNSFQLHI